MNALDRACDDMIANLIAYLGSMSDDEIEEMDRDLSEGDVTARDVIAIGGTDDHPDVDVCALAREYSARARLLIHSGTVRSDGPRLGSLSPVFD